MGNGDERPAPVRRQLHGRRLGVDFPHPNRLPRATGIYTSQLPPLHAARGRVGEGAKYSIIRRMRDPVAQHRSRTLRNQATDAERHLWQHLRRRQLGGHRFRRQVPICGYVADFACLDAKLVIELDGGQHRERRSYDERRDRRIQARGFRVLRFRDNQVFQETEAVLEVILHALKLTCPHPDLPPRAGGKEENIPDPDVDQRGPSTAGGGRKINWCSMIMPSETFARGRGKETESRSKFGDV